MGGRPVILFATHGNQTIGLGHIVRTLTLAKELRQHTDEAIAFYIPTGDGIARYQVLAAGFGLLGSDRPRLVVSDYADSSSASVNGASHVVLADVAEEYQGGNAAVFATHGKPGEQVWAGPDYAILRQQFTLARGRTLRSMRCGLPKVLLSFGGADPCNLTDAVTGALAETPYRLEVILGPAYPHAIRYIERWGNRVDVHRPDVTLTSNMAERMAEADLLLCSGGMTPIEAACVGTPTIVLSQNEREHARMLYWQRAWTGYYLGRGATLRAMDVQSATMKLLSDPETLETMSMRGASLVDGFGAQRVARVILSLPLEARATDAA